MADSNTNKKSQGMKTVWAAGSDQWYSIRMLLIIATALTLGGLLWALYRTEAFVLAGVGLVFYGVALQLFRMAGVIRVPAGCNSVVFTRDKNGGLVGVPERLEDGSVYWRNPKQYRRVFHQGKKSRDIKVKDIKLHFGGDLTFSIAVVVTFECTEDAEDIIKNCLTRLRLAEQGKSHKTALSDIVKKHVKRLIEEPRLGVDVLQEPVEGAKVLLAALKADPEFSREVDAIDGVLSTLKFDIDEATAKTIFEKGNFETVKTRTVNRAADRHLAAVEALEDLLPTLRRINAADPDAMAKLETAVAQLKAVRKAGEHVVHLFHPRPTSSGGGKKNRGS